MTPLEWMMSDDTGTSSKTIMHVMEGTSPPRWVDVPADPSDFGRCHRLLEAFPLYRARLHEVAAMYPAWSALVREWDTLTELYVAAISSGSGKAPDLYKLMKRLIDEGRRADGWTETSPGCWSRGESRSFQMRAGVRVEF